MRFIYNLHFTVGLIAIISLVISGVGIVITIITESDLMFAITGISFLIACLGVVIYNIWARQLKLIE